MNTFFEFIASLQLQNTTIIAAADDLRGVVACFYELIPISKGFEALEHVSGMECNIPKCMLVPLGARFTLARIELYKAWLVCNIPQWAAFLICNFGKYLGFELGPAGGGAMWLKAEQKWLSRAQIVAAAQRAASICTPICNSRIVPVLSYIAQLVPVSTSIIKTENRVRQRLFHVLHHPFPQPSLQSQALPQPRSASLCPLHGYKCSIPNSPKTPFPLGRFSEPNLIKPVGPTFRLLSSCIFPSAAATDGSPMVDYLHEAVQGFPKLVPSSHDAAQPVVRTLRKSKHVQHDFSVLHNRVNLNFDVRAEIARGTLRWVPRFSISATNIQQIRVLLAVLKRDKPQIC
jgi:hypothetical protein